MNRIENGMVNIVTDILSCLNNNIYIRFKEKLLSNNDKTKVIASMADLKRTYRRFDLLIRDCSKSLVITGGLYNYEYFNVCFLNNVLSICNKAINEGYFPIVCIKNGRGENIWEQFFIQPFRGDYNIGGNEIIEEFNEKYVGMMPNWRSSFEKKDIKLFSNLYKRFITLNKFTMDYVQRELNATIGTKRALGVLCRGTDYRTKPTGHPIQPEIDIIVSKVREVFYEGSFEIVYLATEDYEYYQKFLQAFGNRLVINKRSFYDQKMLELRVNRLEFVHFDRENDEYYKGLEYLSSLLILAKCHGLVAGNCGGTQAAIFWNQGRYEYQYIYDLGVN